MTSGVEIGHRVRRARLSAGLTQQQLAGEVGISQAYLSFLENGERRFNEETLSKFSRVLGISIGNLADKEEGDAWQEGFDAGRASMQAEIERLFPSTQPPSTSTPLLHGKAGKS